MKHPILETLVPLRHAPEDALETAVDDLIAETEAGWYEPAESVARRAEALAILGHEIRRRRDG